MKVETYHGCFQIVLLEELAIPLQNWLAARGLNLRKLPLADDDLPTYSVGIMDWKAKEHVD